MSYLTNSFRAHLQNWCALNFAKTKNGKKIIQFKNCHKGERCFLIGNGPSLKFYDLNRLYENNEICFGFNRIYHIFDQTKWRPTYYISQDEKMLRSCADIVSDLKLGIKFIPINLNWYHNIDIKDAVWFYLKTGLEDNGKPLEFSDKPQSVLYNSSTCLYTASQMAAFMGIKQIYLLGVDHHFRVSQNNQGKIVVDESVQDYFTEKYNEDRKNLYVPNTEKSTLTYIAMKEQCEKRGISVFNATRGGKLEIFDRVNFDSLF